MSLDFNFSGFDLEAGCDEAGRGCLAGPVFAAAVILSKDKEIPGLDDSKKLSAKRREELRICIEEQALAWSVARVDHLEIDEINILQASITAMHRAIANLSLLPEFVVIDGIHFRAYRDIPFRCIPQGDSKYQSIAAASILAKTHRDEFMINLHARFPEYGWNKNKGYPTPGHKQAIMSMGFSEFHRKSFHPDLQLHFSL